MTVVEEFKNREVEKLKARMILGQMGGGAPGGGMGGPQNVAASPLAMPPIGVQMKQGPMQGKPQGLPPAPMPPVPPVPPGGPAAPGGKLLNPNIHQPQPQPPGMAQPGVKPDERPETKREREVRKSLENLRGVVMEVAATVYQMPLTEEQVRDISYKLLEICSENIGEITLKRVGEIGHDLIGEILVKKKYS